MGLFRKHHVTGLLPRFLEEGAGLYNDLVILQRQQGFPGFGDPQDPVKAIFHLFLHGRQGPGTPQHREDEADEH